MRRKIMLFETMLEGVKEEVMMMEAVSAFWE